MTEQYHIVVEKGLSSTGYGAKISQYGPFDRATGLVVLARVVDGLEPNVYVPYKQGTVLRVGETQYLDISDPRWSEPSQTRITLAEVVRASPR
ncbi:hypothetical protein [Glycomyces harbinensis]|uniref:Uncharacterized protein n=1 Tax=Glycomyces harbinensis TaxID=58114 RepID=A0A1G7C3U4_9ACTN|nr:hypothetical protein [Glycomyces harbinensis]SDE33981.1 hypothetical protein SAMN05216270_118132 [Glycomyces harbinensis]